MFQVNNWHARFQQQAAWTAPLRQYLLDLVQVKKSNLILETGCGTGVVTLDLHSRTQAQLFGIDIDFPRLKYACQVDPKIGFSCADGLHLPFPDGSFDLAVCHFYLLWVADPLCALREMRRVTRSGGWVLAFAEPDYGGRIDHPEQLAVLGILQSQSLRAQGADPQIGRRLPALFMQAGFDQVTSGLMGGEWRHPDRHLQTDLEWETLAEDLRGALSDAELDEFRRMEEAACSKGERLLFVPTFYACAQN